MPADSVERFCRALWRGEDATVRTLARRVPVNGVDRFGYTPLSMAAQYGDLALVQRLIGRGATPDQGRQHLTPLTFAARRGASDMVDFLRAQGASESLVTAVYLGNRARLQRALAADAASARLRDEQGTPLLHHAAVALAPDLIALLLDHGAPIAEADGRGETALHQACDGRRSDPEAVRASVTLLLDRGADPNARNWDQVTPLHQAVRARNLPAVELLLARGADPNARDGIRGSTPLRRAVSATGASSTAGTSHLMVPLTRLLLAHGADPDLRDKRGIRVRDSARAPDVLAVLDEHRRAQRKQPGRPPDRRPAGQAPKKRR